MRYVAAYLLTIMGGKTAPSVADVEKVLGSVGIESDTERVKKIINELNGKSTEDLIAKGLEKLCSMPVGGAAPAAAAGGAAPAVAEVKKEEKKEEKKAESESEDDDMGFGLFD